MDFLNFFRQKKPASASVARDRLMLAVAVQRGTDGRHEPLSYLPKLKEELLAVVRKYVQVPDSAVQVSVQKEGDLEVLEMNIALGDAKDGK